LANVDGGFIKNGLPLKAPRHTLYVENSANIPRYSNMAKITAPYMIYNFNLPAEKVADLEAKIECRFYKTLAKSVNMVLVACHADKLDLEAGSLKISRDVRARKIPVYTVREFEQLLKPSRHITPDITHPGIVRMMEINSANVPANYLVTGRALLSIRDQAQIIALNMMKKEGFMEPMMSFTKEYGFESAEPSTTNMLLFNPITKVFRTYVMIESEEYKGCDVVQVDCVDTVKGVKGLTWTIVDFGVNQFAASKAPRTAIDSEGYVCVFA
jgi:hypothetical protein